MSIAANQFASKAYRDIKNVEADTTHVLLTAYTLLGRPLERRDARILDFVEVLNTLCDIDEQVGASGIGAETPDLTSIGDIPAELVRKKAGAQLVIVTSADLAGLDGECELLLDGHGLNVDTVVLVLRLGERNDRGLGLDGLTVRNDGVGNLQWDTSVVLLEILKE